ncbi:hypothetical protein MWU49_02485 [Alcanivorax sp. S6407]|uniref:hypothetical protein n=1 Tax=Alcanivorax sp. S6407 TaxID=2926424 RepID=UPI001FF387F3|nr:hypothetical protein [Alcanivorax sp. S6407]MCK0152559.1 hypothetical protein [Alcanivorax sp. S6407]
MKFKMTKPMAYTKQLPSSESSHTFSIAASSLFCLLIAPLANAMVELEEEQMAGVTGAGLAFVLDDFSFRMAPTSYAELTGSAPSAAAAAAGWTRGDARYYGISMTSGYGPLGASNGPQGVAGRGTTWWNSSATGGGCGTFADAVGGQPNLQCPLGIGDGDFGVPGFATPYDPYMLRVFEYEGFDYQGVWRGDSAPIGYSGPVESMPTMLEFRGPIHTDPWRWAFWGEFEIDRGTWNGTTVTGNDPRIGACNNSDPACSGGADFLQSQTIIFGNPYAIGHVWNGTSDDDDNPNTARTDQGYTKSPGPLRTVQRWAKTLNDNDPTFGVSYTSALSGDFRFSVRQIGNVNDPELDSDDQLHHVPRFHRTEGMYFRNVDAYIPGTWHYQAITFSGTSDYSIAADGSINKLATPIQNGNFTIEMTRIPNNANVYSYQYCGSTSGSCELNDNGDGFLKQINRNTHGYVRWGNWCADADCTATIDPYDSAYLGTGEYDLPTSTISTDWSPSNPGNTGNGIYFIGSNPVGGQNNNAVVNLGISRLEGMQIQHMKITSLGAGS